MLSPFVAGPCMTEKRVVRIRIKRDRCIVHLAVMSGPKRENIHMRICGVIPSNGMRAEDAAKIEKGHEQRS